MKQKILSLLEQDSRLTASKVAIMLGIDEAAAAAAIKELEDENIILGYKALINWELTDREMTVANIELKLTPQRGGGFDTVAERIYKFPQVKSVTLMSGAYDLLVTVEGKSLKEVAMFVSERLAPMESVVSTATHFELKTYKKDGIIFTEKEKDNREVISI
ncbi:MAG: Lrp/AsnC family transcriptional regulator [Clostridia bacterium]|nr:Lrp/AsnC family transcriptional regulator [Clostridia bacterium]MBQ6937913.1 Lrp/AsnC family transcriptional regulator [Clostridia bacterium]MBR2885232.1 Lrp/AsnC family transcriptional regulator [Clostridia bacterium]